MKDRLAAALGRSAADYTEIRYHRRHRTAVLLRGRELESATTAIEEIGAVRCLRRGQAWGLAAVHHPSQLPAAVQRAHELSLTLPGPAGLALARPPARAEEIGCPAGRDPRAVSLAAKRGLADAVAAAVLGFDRRVVACRVRYQDEVDETWLVTSDGIALYQARPGLELAVMAVAEEGGGLECAFDSLATPGGWAETEAWLPAAPAIAQRAVARLHAAPITPGRYPVVLDPRAAGVLVHRVIGHRCRAAPTARAAPAPADVLPLGTRVGPELLTVGDDGTALGLRGTLAFDHEGAPPQNTVLVRHGVVVGHIHTRASALAAGVAPSGNARAAAGEAPEARLTNTYLAGTGGETSLEDLLRDIPLGVYLADPRTAAMDRGRLTLAAGLARMIRGGALAEPVKGAALTGPALALLGLVDAVGGGGDFRWDAAASRCRVSSARSVPVSLGAPHVRLVEAPIGAVE